MLKAIISLLFALIVFFILTETLTIDFKIGENYAIEINFMVFAVVLQKSKFDGLRSKRKKPRKRGKYLKYSVILMLLPKASLKINSLTLTVPKSNPATDAVLCGIYNGIIASFLAFLENNSNFLDASNISIEYSEHNTFKKQLDAELKISLLDVLISYVKFYGSEIYYRFIYKRMRATE